MRAPTLAFIFILAEYSIITGGDGNCGDPPEVKNALKVQNPKESQFRMKCMEGYLRQAGTSNLFKCEANKWLNKPEFVCIRNPSLADVTTQSHSSAPPVNQTSSSSTSTPLCVTTQAEKSTTRTRKIVLTKPYTTSTTTWTSQETSQRSTTVMETTVTTSKTATITTSSTTEKENLTTVSTHSPSNLSTTTTGKEGITAGTIILVIIVALAVTVAILFWHRRSRPPGDSGPSLIMLNKPPDTQQPLMNPITITSNCPQDSIQPPFVPFRDSVETTYANFEIST